MPRPRIDIEKDATDWIIEIVGFLFLAGLILTPLYFYDTLPDQIATHYNGAGKADGFSDKNSIWTLPAVGLVMFTGLYILTKYPHICNYPTEITDENAERQYRNATKLIRILNTISIGAFLYISSQTILGALDKYYGLGTWFLPVFMLVMFVPIIFFIVSARRNKG